MRFGDSSVSVGNSATGGVMQRYGELMRPLVVSEFLGQVGSLYCDDPQVLRWLALLDRVSRAEFVSCWADWTPEQTQAWGDGDWRLFSRLRGYTDAEIEEFSEWLELTQALTTAYQDEDLCANLGFLYEQLVMTPELALLKVSLRDRSQAALRS